MTNKKLTEGRLLEKLDEWFETVADYGEVEDKQAYQQIRETVRECFKARIQPIKYIFDTLIKSPIIEAYRLDAEDDSTQQKPAATLTEIRELSARLRDTSRQSLYETKLRRWLESKGMEVTE